MGVLTSSQADLPPVPAERKDLVEEIHGVEVADPYRWMEDVDSEMVKAWIAAQNARTEAYFEETAGRERIRERLETLWDYDKYGIPRIRGDRLFFTRKSGLQNQAVLLSQPNIPDAEAEVLLDPNEWSDDGTVALSGWEVSRDGRWLAYGRSTAGSDWQEWRVREVATQRDLDDRVRWVKFSGAEWAPDGSGFYYSRYDEPPEGEELEAVSLNQKVYFHRLGERQEKDELILARPDEPKWGFGAGVSDDGAYLLFHVWSGAGGKNAFYYRNLDDREAEVKAVIRGFDSSYDFLGNDGSVFYFLTDDGAPRSKIVSVDVEAEERVWKTLIPEGETPIRSVSLLGDRFFVSRLRDVQTEVAIHRLTGERLERFPLPGVGSVYGFGGERDAKETFYYFTSYTVPGSIYRYDLESGDSQVFVEPDAGFDASSYETRQVFYRSKDGTRVPMFLTGPRGLPKTGEAPVYLYGYGGFNISLTPYYSSATAAWLEMGGWYAVANLRGGGEYGEAWHEAGTKGRKQSVFDDFQAAAEFLVREGYTRPDRLGIGGGSNGGLLVGACVNQRPGLFGAAIADVGVFDMLRFHQFTIGWAWTEDFGDPADPEEFRSLLAYSPYHNTQTERPYPPVLLMTADHDDRVFPAHTFKFGAALQHAQTGEAPILVRVETKAGHGAGKPTSKAIEEIVDKWSFLSRELDMDIQN